MKKVLIYLCCCIWVIVSGCEDGITVAEFENFTWKTSTPEEQGMNAQTLDSAFIKAEQLGFVDCVLIIKNGFIVAEQYYNGYNESIPHNTWSVSKSFLSAITGIALSKGSLQNLDEKRKIFLTAAAITMIVIARSRMSPRTQRPSSDFRRGDPGFLVCQQ